MQFQLKIPATFFTKVKKILKFIWNKESHKIVKVVLTKKSKVGKHYYNRFHIASNFHISLCYKVTVIKTLCCWSKRDVLRCKTSEAAETLCTFVCLDF